MEKQNKFLRYMDQVKARLVNAGEDPWVTTRGGIDLLASAGEDMKAMHEMCEFMYGLLLEANIDKEYMGTHQALMEMIPDEDNE